MGHKAYCAVSGAVFSLVALAHFLRVIDGTTVLLDDYAVPMLLSWFGLAVTAMLGIWGIRLSLKPGS
jgi:hypothetical protein